MIHMYFATRRRQLDSIGMITNVQINHILSIH